MFYLFKFNQDTTVKKDKIPGITTNKTELLVKKLSKNVFGFDERQEKTTDFFVSIMKRKDSGMQK